MSSTNSKKNKRGARGSTEEELTVSKRPNMETDNERTEEEVEETDATEPNLSNIRALLLSIQKATNNILKENNKLSNEDGELFDSIGGHLLERLNAAHEVGELSISQRRGVITLIPKDESDLVDLQNWRPITQLNTDYTIASKALARRIETILPKPIHPDQTGFRKGQYIAENLRLISDVMEYTKMGELTGVLVSLDFKKAFDTLEWQFIKAH